MPSSNIGFECGRLFGKFPDNLGHLMHSSPGTKHRVKPKAGQRWALDNGAYGAFQSGKPWTEEPFFSYLEEFSYLRPDWAVVPDVVGDKKKTLDLWKEYAPAVAAYGAPLAFACQDGMTAADVPGDAEIVFIGGSTSWKWRTLNHWVKNFKRVHVGRVNTYRMLWICHETGGVESCDGTGWFKHPERTAELEQYLEEATTGKKAQMSFNL